MDRNNHPPRFENTDQLPPSRKVQLRLYIAGLSLRSQQTIQTLREVCEHRLTGQYELEIIDIYQQPDLARQYQIVATPTLIRFLPVPKKMIIGDLSRIDRVLVCLGLPAA